MSSKHFDPVREWWNNREESEHSWKVSKDEVIKRNYNLDFKNPNTPEEEIHEPEVLLGKYREVNMKIQALQESLLEELRDLL